MSQCYFPSGDIAQSYTPCSEDDGGDDRHCCNEGHYCLSNKLCLVPADMTIYRGACTTDTWDNAMCSGMCLKYSTHSGVWRCNNNTSGSGKRLFACDLEGCGVSDQMFEIDEGQIQRNKQLSSAIDLQAEATKTVRVTAATTTGSCVVTGNASPDAGAAQATVSGNAICESGISTGAAVGIGLGSSLPFLIALAIVCWLFWRERKRGRRGLAGDKITTNNGFQYHSFVARRNGYFSPGSIRPSISELSNHQPTATTELEGSERR